MNLNTEERALEFFKHYAMTTPEPLHGMKLSEAEFDRMPEPIKKMMANLLVGYAETCGSTPVSSVLDAICKEAKKKSHSDTSFGMIVKQILGKVI